MDEILAFCGKKGWVLQNHELGIHSDKLWADSDTKNTLEYLTTDSAPPDQIAEIFVILKKKLSLGVRSPYIQP